MRTPERFTVRAALHPDPAVQAGGFDLAHVYVKECWAPLLGEPATRLVQHLPTIWRDQQVAVIERSRAGGDRLREALDRLVEYDFAEWRPAGDRRARSRDRVELAVYTRVSPLGDHDLERVTPAVRARHHELAGPIIDRAFPTATIDDPSFADRAAYLARRLDALTPSRDALGL